MYSDTTKNPELGFGAICQASWTYSRWDPEFIKSKNPSMKYLELFGVVAGVLNWVHRFSNRRIILFCDNSSIVDMINNTSSKCRNCMVLIRFLVLEGLVRNVRILARHVAGSKNFYSDLLSRIKIDKFKEKARELNRTFDPEPSELSQQIWPISKIWLDS